MKTLKPPSWYREPLVWLVIFFPAVAVVVGFTGLYLAITSDDGLVVDDYYKQGLEINQVLARDQAAGLHGLQATLDFKRDPKLIYLALSAKPDYVLPNQIELKLSHHTQHFDSRIILEHIDNALYRGALPDLKPGAWYAELAADDWRLLKSLQVPIKIEKLYITSP
jgi:hypothetical protein